MFALAKGSSVSLTEVSLSSLELKVVICWPKQPVATSSIEAVCFMLAADSEKLNGQEFVSNNKTASQDGAVEYLSNDIGFDGLAGAVIKVDLSKLSPTTERLVFAVDALPVKGTGQSQAKISEALICVVDSANDRVLASFEQRDSASSYQSIVLAELVLFEDEWWFLADGVGGAGGVVQTLHILQSQSDQAVPAVSREVEQQRDLALDVVWVLFGLGWKALVIFFFAYTSLLMIYGVF